MLWHCQDIFLENYFSKSQDNFEKNQYQAILLSKDSQSLRQSYDILKQK
jgi:hypothetical protein